MNTGLSSATLTDAEKLALRQKRFEACSNMNTLDAAKVISYLLCSDS